MQEPEDTHQVEIDKGKDRANDGQDNPAHTAACR
jgi:hypothetical protein